MSRGATAPPARCGGHVGAPSGTRMTEERHGCAGALGAVGGVGAPHVAG